MHLLHSCSHSAATSAVPRKLRSTGSLCGLQRYIGLVIHLGRLLDPLIDVDDPFTTVTAQNSRVQRRELGWVVFLISLSRDLTPDMQTHRDTQLRSTSHEAVVIRSWRCLITLSPVSQVPTQRPVSGKLCGPAPGPGNNGQMAPASGHRSPQPIIEPETG